VATNQYFKPNVKSEQNLVEDLIIESLKMYGQDVYYLPRDIVNKDPIFADDIPSRFNSSYRIEMYIENADGFDGDGDLMTKFGVELRDSVTLIVSRRRWKHTVGRFDNQINSNRPREGDIIFIPLSNSMFEITQVEHEQPFYQINNLPTFKLRCEKFEYNEEQLDTGVEVIDSIEQIGYRQVLQLVDSASTGFIIGSTLTQALPSGVTVTGEIVAFNDSDGTIEVTHVGSSDNKFHTFVSGVLVTTTDENGYSIVRLVDAVGEELNDPGAQNPDFADVDFVDWSEDNPFGSPN
jgi:hypothetical protein